MTGEGVLSGCCMLNKLNFCTNFGEQLLTFRPAALTVFRANTERTHVCFFTSLPEEGQSNPNMGRGALFAAGSYWQMNH